MLVFCAAHAQIPVVNLTGKNCPGSVLTLHSDIPPGIIQWSYNGTSIRTVNSGWEQNGTTVAGGNGWGTGPANLIAPDYFCLDGSGNLYISDFGNDRVQLWTPGATAGITVAGGNGPGGANNQTYEPDGICRDGAGNLYIADYFYYRVQMWTPGATSGITVAGGNGFGTALNQLTNAFTVNIDPAGNLYIDDAGNDRVVKWVPGASSGTIVAGGNGRGAAANQLNNPMAACLDTAGNMYILDRGNFRIQKWPAGGSSGITLPVSFDFNDGVTNIYVDGIGNLYLVCSGTNRIKELLAGTSQVVVAAGDTTRLFGSGPNQFFTCYSAIVDSVGDLYVSDTHNYRMQKFLPLIPDTLTAMLPGTYTATVTTFSGKTAVASFTVDPSSSIVISASAASDVCAGTSVRFDATATNGGASPLYQWEVNNRIVGGNNASLISTISAGDTVVCKLIPSDGCTEPSQSNRIALTVHPNVTPAVSVSTGDTLICKGSSAHFTAVLTNGGASPSYSWLVNGAIIGTTGPSFTTTNLNNGDVITCEASSAESCVTAATVRSTPITVQVSNAVAPAVSIQADHSNICAGNTVNFTATVSGQGTSPLYQWLVNGIQTGANSPAFQSSALKNGDQVSCQLTGSLACSLVKSVSSNTVQMAVLPLVTPTVQIYSTRDTVCSGSTVTFVASATNGGSAPAFLWRVNGNDAASGSAAFSTGNLNNGDVVNCVLKSTAACVSDDSAISNIVTVHVKPLVKPTLTITASTLQTCKDSTVYFSVVSVTHPGTSPTYWWQVNNAGFDLAFAPVAVSYPNFHKGDVVTCFLTSNESCLTQDTVWSNALVIDVKPTVPTAVSIAASANDVCQGTDIQFTAMPENGGTSPSYSWLVNGLPTGTNQATFETNHLNNDDQVSCVMHSDLACSAPSQAQPISVAIKEVPKVTASAAASSLSLGSSTQLTASTDLPVVHYQWSPAAGLSDSTLKSPLASPTQNTTYIVSVLADDGCSATAEVTIKVLRDLFMPNAFSPNGDGKNDLFRIPSGVQLNLSGFTVYDRWGGIVFSTKELSRGWDGTSNGAPCPAGTYVYTISGSTDKGKVFLKGTVVLLR